MVGGVWLFEECVDHIIDHIIIRCVRGTYQKIGKEIEVVFVL